MENSAVERLAKELLKDREDARRSEAAREKESYREMWERIKGDKSYLGDDL
ncbi:hypothetical protein [Bradyrhizobium acaciae]|uniref:hypothetical protein n=1 Tax=Bradyrhizobium acaciae TaxID=2683706 RepID=UPI001E65D3D6|nr:hypothetical protein [Bradyrhizobium acaciae]MCC8977582.1 hypothetical protein [Bradyrhizobium acaciae]